VCWTTGERPTAFFEPDVPGEDTVGKFLAKAVLGVATGWDLQAGHVHAAFSELIKPPPELTDAFKQSHVSYKIFAPWCGVMTGLLRRVWPLLSTIDDLPILFVPQTKLAHGFRAKARYHRFLEHKTITLSVPQLEARKLVRKAVADAKRRAHQVRGHWRKDWRRPLSALCEHEFDDALVCSKCGGHKIWVHEHQRGDASVGFVTHDYRVVH
jgi:hypothetical protein